MACTTCRREDMDDSCGPQGNEPCPCCGMRIIATAEQSQEQAQEVSDNEEE